MSACHANHVMNVIPESQSAPWPPTGFLQLHQELFADFVGSLEHALDAEDAWRSMMVLILKILKEGLYCGWLSDVMTPCSSEMPRYATRLR